MAKIFNRVKGQKVQRNVFNLSHERKMSMDMGKLIPFLCQEVVPGDTFRVDSEFMMRFAPMLAPVMHRINVFTHYFYIPNRIVWNEWEDFITGKPDYLGNPVPNFPKVVISGSAAADVPHIEPGSLADYMGVSHAHQQGDWTGQIDFSVLPFRAYQMVYNEYYRDQDLTDELNIRKDSANLELDSGDSTPEELTLRYRSWEKDYFTSARPWAQKGEAVQLPLGDTAPIDYLDVQGTLTDVRRSDTGEYDFTTGSLDNDQGNLVNNVGTFVNVDVSKTHVVDLSSATATTINELRRAFQLQKWLERNARSGSRYTELLRAHFGVKSSDARLQRPEYLGGGRQPVSISEVLQTSESTEGGSLGDMAGHGISVGRSNRFKRFFEEHGFVIGIVSVLPRTTYQQGLPKQLFKYDKFDYFWPEFQHIGEQEIKQKEIFHDGSAEDEDTFGYTPRYAEYKYVPSSVHGDFKTSLNYWHMGRVFSQPPPLSDGFVKADPTTRIFNVMDAAHHKIWVQVYNRIKAVRPMAVFGEPGFIDH